ncbi:hypothetical protein LshimejAT787_0705910 [Lyophyllum shimeji]|uniref:HAT C-terminal dimerisation domain-containing protein n=1 Tax=Lyophyllum shimeji TaxID=47721 RepID=A0A9P3PRM4_LYOSH|nr:hypothetical protein LshimejAT787_0705910 [Lyophyllum shimeji]
MTEMLERPSLLPAFRTINRARCFLHIIKLTVKALLRQFDPTKKEDQTDVDLSTEELELLSLEEGIEEEELATAREADDDKTPEDDELGDWVDEVEALTAEERANLHLEILPVRRVLVKLRKLAFKIIHSTTILLPAWKSCLAKLKLSIRIMPRDVRTRWNSTYDMLSFAIEYKDVIVALTSDAKNDLWKFELSVAEWEIAMKLASTLKALKDATLYFSRRTPNLPYVIPVMDTIDTLFTNALKPTENGLAMRAAIKLAKATLNRYYSKTDQSDVYRIAMVLHPCHKLHYFEQAGWKEDWITTARLLVREEFESSYANRTTDDSKNGEADANSSESDMEMVPPAAKDKTSKTASQNMFDDLFAITPSASKPRVDELALYLSTEPENVSDALKWWHEKRLTYPRLSRMALDYLSIPGLWSLMGMVRDEDVTAVGQLDEVDGQIELEELVRRLEPKIY